MVGSRRLDVSRLERIVRFGQGDHLGGAAETCFSCPKGARWG